MSFDAHANLANSLVATAPSPANSGTSLTVTAGQGALFPAAPFNCIVCPANSLPTTTNAEIVRVTAVVGDAFTIVRAQEGTSARNIVSGDYIANAITKKTLTDVEGVASAPPLSSLSASTSPNTIASGNNTGQVWNWANTSDSTVALSIGETTASTNGTSTSGIPNQILLKLITLAASTQSPLSVYSRGTHVFSISPSTAQIFATNGSIGSPAYSFAANTGTGLYCSSANSNAAIGLIAPASGFISFRTNAAVFMAQFSTTQLNITSGTATVPAITDATFVTTGLYWPASHVLGISDSTSGEIARFTGGATPSVSLSAPVVPPSYTVSGLPAASSYTYGIVSVSDATNAAGTGLGTAPTGSGSVKRMVYSDGTNWLLM